MVSTIFTWCPNLKELSKKGRGDMRSAACLYTKLHEYRCTILMIVLQAEYRCTVLIKKWICLRQKLTLQRPSSPLGLYWDYSRRCTMICLGQTGQKNTADWSSSDHLSQQMTQHQESLYTTNTTKMDDKKNKTCFTITQFLTKKNCNKLQAHEHPPTHTHNH